MNNRRTAGKIQLIITLLLITLLALWICTISVYSMMNSLMQWGFGSAVLLTLLYFMFGGFYYIEIEKEDDMLNFKFYNSFPFSREFKMFRIPVAAFVRYETLGLPFFRSRLNLYQMSSNQISKYPSIFITAMSSKDRRNLTVFLNAFVK